MFFEGLNDYAIDKRGDVGSWVREESMHSLEWAFNALYEDISDDQRHHIIPPDEDVQFYIRFVEGLLQQLLEKIDKMREVAGNIL